MHYLGDQIINYISKKNFNLDISIIEEKEKILDTGGGVLNAIKHFSDDPFLVINPDTVWNLLYLECIKKMDEFFTTNKIKNILLVVNKKLSFDRQLNGDFNLEGNRIIKSTNSVDYIIANSNFTKGLANKVGIDVSKVHVIFPGIPKPKKIENIFKLKAE